MSKEYTREEYIYLAKLYEKAERFNDMVNFINKFIEMNPELSHEERIILSAGYKNVISSKRSSWRLVNTLIKKEDKSNTQTISYLNEEKSIIAGYTTLINWENTSKETVTALIEVKITPQRGEGFDKVAERIYNFDQVKACYLMSSGGFDLTVIVEGKTMKEVAMFVSEKLAVQDNVIGTATHFVLKKYKDHGTIFKEKKVSNREVIFI